jgi:hypothetical protein
MIFNTKMWCQLAMGQFYGYTVEGGEASEPTEYYEMAQNKELGLDQSTFSIYNSMNIVGYLPALMLLSPVFASFNKKCILGFVCMLWGVSILLHAFAQNIT